MFNNSQIKQLYEQIERNLIRLIPEKWEKICLYASFSQTHEHEHNSELFFYYYPKSLLKRNPINAYEVPKKFHIIEEDYSNLINKLYKQIKTLRNNFTDNKNKLWTNITVIISESKLRIIFNYDDLEKSEFNNYERHIIWRYKYLHINSESCTRNEKEILDRYFQRISDNIDNNDETYEENIYLNAGDRRVIGLKEEYIRELNVAKVKTVKEKKKKEKQIEIEEQEEIIEEKVEYNKEEITKRSQILNTNIF